MIETSMLNVLIALSHNETISKAAEELNVTQSAVSQTIKNLEARVGLALVTRKGKAVRLTEDGHRLARVAETFTKKLQDTIDQIHLENNEIQGTLRVGSLYGLGKTWLSSRMMGFIAQHPQLEVRLFMDFPDKILKKFEEREIDCMIVPDSLVPAYAEKELLHSEHVTLVYPKSFAINAATELKDILKFPVIFYAPNDPNFYRWCREKFAAVPRNIKPRLMVNSFGQMLSAVNEGLGIAVVPTHVLKRNQRPHIAVGDQDFEVFSNHVSFAYHADEQQNLKLKEFYSFLLEVAKDLQ